MSPYGSCVCVRVCMCIGVERQRQECGAHQCEVTVSEVMLIIVAVTIMLTMTVLFICHHSCCGCVGLCVFDWDFGYDVVIVIVIVVRGYMDEWMAGLQGPSHRATDHRHSRQCHLWSGRRSEADDAGGNRHTEGEGTSPLNMCNS